MVVLPLSLTYEVPLSISNETWNVSAFLSSQGEVQLHSIVCPRSELHVTFLVVEWKPRDIYLASTLEDARGNIRTATVAPNHHVRGKGPIKFFVGTLVNKS